MFGFILEGDDYNLPVPIFIGEFSTSKRDSTYWTYLIKYLSESSVNWAYWSFGSKNDYLEDESE